MTGEHRGGAPPPKRSGPGHARQRSEASLSIAPQRSQKHKIVGIDSQEARRDWERQLRRQRLVERLCQVPRLVLELLDELGRVYDIGANIDQRLADYAELDPDLLRALGGDRFLPAPLWLVARRR
jgi:hypothetical protein